MLGRLTALGDIGTGELIRGAKPGIDTEFPAKLRSEIQVSPGFAEHFLLPPRDG